MANAVLQPPLHPTVVPGSTNAADDPERPRNTQRMRKATFYLSREAQRLGTDRELRRRHALGTMIRLRAGVFIEADAWQGLDPDERYRARVQAAALASQPDAQFSHASAAALWRLPSLRKWPTVVHELVERSAGGTSRVGIVRHGLELDPHAVRIDGVLTTSLSRTLIDVASAGDFASGVVAMDAGRRAPEDGDFRLGMIDSAPALQELREHFRGLLPYPAPARVERVLEFSNPLSGSVAESFARVQFHALGLPEPELQTAFRDELGLIGFADFFWPHLELICEVDGKLKYGAARRYRRDVPAQQVLLEEKDREDRMRRVSKGFVRLDWKKISNRRVLSDYLSGFGLRPLRRVT